MVSMTIKEYAQRVADFLSEKDSNYTFAVRDAIKNGETTCVDIHRKGENGASVLYIKEYYNRGIDPKEVADSIWRDFYENSNKRGLTQGVMEEIQRNIIDWNWVAPRLKARIVSYKRFANTDCICEPMPNTDLAYIAVVELGAIGINGVEGSVKVLKNHASVWGVSCREVISKALGNVKTEDVSIDSVSDMMIAQIPEELLEIPDIREYVDMCCSVPLYYVTNSTKTYGAIYAFDKSVLRNFSNMKGGFDVFILPSSVHECIYVSLLDVDEDIESLRWIVGSVNRNAVPDDMYLSDGVFRYFADTNEIRQVA